MQPEISDHIGREIRDQRQTRFALRNEAGAAIGAEEFEIVDAYSQRVGLLTGNTAHADRLRPDSNLDRRPRCHRLVDSADEAVTANLYAIRPGGDTAQQADAANEIRHEGGRRVAIDLLGRADLLDDAVVHHHDALGHRQRLLLIMRDHEGCDPEAALHVADFLAQADAHLRIKRGKRLVEQQQPRRGRERTGQRHALLLPAGKLRRILRELAGQPDHLEQFAHARGDLRLRAALVDKAVADVLRNREIGKQGIGLKNDAEITLGGRRIRNIAPIDMDGARSLAIEPRDGTQKRRLAAAGGAEEADEFAPFHVEIDLAQRLKRAEGLGNPADGDERRLACRERLIRHAAP